MCLWNTDAHSCNKVKNLNVLHFNPTPFYFGACCVIWCSSSVRNLLTNLQYKSVCCESPTKANISISYILTPCLSQGYVMLVKCEKHLGEFTDKVWLLYHHHLPKARVDSCSAATTLASYIKNFPGWPTLLLLHGGRPVREVAYTVTYILTSWMIKADLVWKGKKNLLCGLDLLFGKWKLSKSLWSQIIFPDSHY